MPTTVVPPPSMTNLAPFWAFRPEESARSPRVWDDYQPQVQYPSSHVRGNDAFPIITIGQITSSVPNPGEWPGIGGVGMIPAQRGRLLALVRANLNPADIYRTRAGQSTAWPVRRIWLGPVTRRLDQLAQLERDWDSYGGEPPTETALTLAREYAERVAAMLGHVVGDRAHPSSISPLTFGGIELEWRGPEALVAVDIGPEGELGFLLRQGHGPAARYRERDNVSWAEALAHIFDVLLPVS